MYSKDLRGEVGVEVEILGINPTHCQTSSASLADAFPVVTLYANLAQCILWSAASNCVFVAPAVLARIDCSQASFLGYILNPHHHGQAVTFEGADALSSGRPEL